MKNKILLLFLAAILITGCSANTSIEEKQTENNPVAQSEFGENSDLETEEPQNKIDNKLIEENKMENSQAKTDSKNVLIKTSLGDIKIELNPGLAPVSVENFLAYVRSGFYNGTIFHRVINGFMIQGGGFDEAGKEKTTQAPIKNEAQNGLKNDRGTIAMARTMVVDSATSQFFINLADNDFLNFRSADAQGYGYAVFGKVVEGMDVVDKIAQVKTGDNGAHQNWPVENVALKSVEIIE